MFLPNRGVNSPYYVPPAEQLPVGFPRWLAFEFPVVAAFATQQLSITVTRRTLVYAITEIHDQNAGYRLLVYHQHGQQQRQLGNKSLPQSVTAGRAGAPLFLRETELVEPGDVLTVQVESLAAAAQFVQVALIAVELD